MKHTLHAAGLAALFLGTTALAQTNRPHHKPEGSREGRPSREEIMKKYDTDGDGQLNEAEREAMRQEMGRRRPPDGRSREELMKRFDTDGDGVLSEAEREAMREELGHRRPPEGSREEVMQKYDTDGDGVLSESEREAMRADQQRKHESS